MPQIAFLGVAHIHTPGFLKDAQKRDGITIKSVWDHDAGRAKARADEVGAKVADSFKSVLADPEIDSVIICSETDRHAELVPAAAEAKKNIYVEKPLGMGAKDAFAMADAINKAGVKFQTGYFQRGLPAHLFIKNAIDKKQFGKITRARFSNCHGGALKGWFDTQWRWMADPKQSGMGGFGDLGTHGLDLLMWWLGDVSHCTAAIDNGTARYPGCDELGEGLIRFKSGAIATLGASWDDVANPVTAQICGTEGNAVIVDKTLYFVSEHVEGSDIKEPAANLPEPKHAGFEAFLDAIMGKEAELVTPAEAAARSAVMESMYQSARRAN